MIAFNSIGAVISPTDFLGFFLTVIAQLPHTFDHDLRALLRRFLLHHLYGCVDVGAEGAQGFDFGVVFPNRPFWESQVRAADDAVQEKEESTPTAPR